MSIHPPYHFNKTGNYYKFITDKSVVYNVLFTDGSYYFNGLPEHILVFELSLSFSALGGTLSPSYDNRIEITVVKIISDFLSDVENSAVYLCDTSDKRQKARKRKFDFWFNKHSSDELEKYDLEFNYENIEFLPSLIVHKNNPFREELVEIFKAQTENYKK